MRCASNTCYKKTALTSSAVFLCIRRYEVWALYDLIEQATANGEKVNNYALAEQVGIEVEQRNTEEEWDDAYKRRVVSVAVSRKKKVAVDAISNAVKGIFLSSQWWA